MGVAFYFFNNLQNQSSKFNSADAFRAILTQLLHNHKDDQMMIDAASLMMRDTSKSQIEASHSDVLSLLQWSLQRYPDTILVFDGIDECRDLYKFFSHLQFIQSQQTACLTSKAVGEFSSNSEPTRINSQAANAAGKTSMGPAIALFTRPDIHIPASILGRSHHIHLNADQNARDVIAFLGPSLQELLEDGSLGEDQKFDDILTRTTRHADGMFLWVQLLMDYLRWDGLTIQDRLDALDNLTRLEGLDTLYHAILKNLQEKLPGPLKIKSKNTFRWVMGASRPLHIDELRLALGIDIASPLSERTLIPHGSIQKALSRMSGALLEMAPDKTVRFVHLSVREYLSREPSVADKNTRGLDLQWGKVQRFLATSCLKYLSRHVPSGPLSGSAKVRPDKQVQQTMFRLLDYSLNYWVRHAEQGLDRYELQETSPMAWTEDGSRQQFVEVVRDFLNNREMIMTWIEASWLFGVPPSVGNLPSIFSSVLCRQASGVRLPAASPSSKRMALEGLVLELDQFSRDLDKLNKSWGHILSEAPNEIWEPSILAFTKSAFWADTQDAAITNLGSSKVSGENSLSIRSQISSTASEIGLIKLIFPR